MVMHAFNVTYNNLTRIRLIFPLSSFLGWSLTFYTVNFEFPTKKVRENFKVYKIKVKDSPKTLHHKTSERNDDYLPK